MTEDELIERLFIDEGTTYGDQTTHPPIDQPTAAGGITLGALREYALATGQIPIADIATLKSLTKDTAKPIIRWKLRQLAKANGLDKISYEPLYAQMLDFAYNSGPGLAIRWLQRVLRVPRNGKMDAVTVDALNRLDPWLTNQALVAARLEMIDRWTDSNKQAKAWEEGLESRGLRFSQLEIP